MDRRRAGEAATAKQKLVERAVSRMDDELWWFRKCLRWTCMDQSSAWRTRLSFLAFLLFAVAVPAGSHFILAYRPDRRPYNAVVESSLSSASAVSFVCLSYVLRRYGLRSTLFVDRLETKSSRVRENYTARLSRSFERLVAFVVPCFLAEAAYKLWWYAASIEKVPFFGGNATLDCAAGLSLVLELASWIYRTATYFLNCLLFRLICHLQGLRLEDFAMVMQSGRDVEEGGERFANVSDLLKYHLDIRRQLKVISHRFRIFIVACTLLVTASQFASVLVATRRQSVDDVFHTAELALCSIVLVVGLIMILRSAAKITHQAHSLTGLAAKWHACCSVDYQVESTDIAADQYSDDNSVDDDSEDLSSVNSLENMKIVQPHANTLSFQKRQALVTYLENNKAGITIFGFTLERGYIHTIFTLEWTLFLWLLGKTIGIS